MEVLFEFHYDICQKTSSFIFTKCSLSSMLFLLILSILVDLSYTTNHNGNVSSGSTIFINRRRAQCWSEDEIIKLRARKVFEELIPAQVNPDEINGKYIREMLRYLRRTLHSVDKENDPNLAKLLQEAIADTIGAHLRNSILPTTRFAFYAGYVPYRNARQIHDFYNEIKDLLNTQGLGWKRSEGTPPLSNLTVAKILIGSGSFFDPCTSLVIKRDSNSCIHMPTPKLDNDIDPSAIALPFTTGGLVSLTSPSSNNILLKYYTTAARCILSSSPRNCRHADFLNFNNEMWNWMKRDVAPHLANEKLYTAYGGVLRIAAAVQAYGRGLTRRNLFEYQDAQLTKWHPWRSLTESYVLLHADWSPTLYIAVVIVIAIAIYLILIIYNYVCGPNCQCKGRSSSVLSREVAYANVESSIPALLPQQSTVYYSDKKRGKRSLSKSKSASLGSIRTQKVYDLNENTEKLMAVIMSGNEESLIESSTSDSDGEIINERSKRSRPSSPPKIETSISEVTINKRVFESPMYSTSTVTRNAHVIQASDSNWSASESYTGQSVTSSTSKSCTPSRSSRDLAWARKVISKHAVRSTTTSKSELDYNSFTTPPSRR